LVLFGVPPAVAARAVVREGSSKTSEVRMVPRAPSENDFETDWRLRRGDFAGPVSFVAKDPVNARLAVGGRGALVLAEVSDGALMNRLSRTVPGDVVDMVFMTDGDLWVATTEGLFRFSAEGHRQSLAPAAGAGPGAVRRLTRLHQLLLAATDQGVWVFQARAGWRQLTPELPALRVVAVAPGHSVKESELRWKADVWIVLRNHLYRVIIEAEEDSFRVLSVRQIEVSGWPVGDSALDGVWDSAGGQFVLVFERQLILLPDSEESPEGGRRHMIRPHLPPGFRMSRLFNADGLMWLTSEDGLAWAEQWPTRWRRAGMPIGAGATRALVDQGHDLFVAGQDGLWSRPQRRRESPLRRADFGRLSVKESEPALGAIARKALERAGLEPQYWQRLRRRLHRRVWWPDVTLSAGARYDRDSFFEYDENFSYGQLNRLNDRSRGRSRDFEGAIVLRWPLGDWVYNPDSIDLSREGRQVVILRDTVLDEISQLYFDRRRAQLALSRFLEPEDPEAGALRLRIEELEAGLDAWTGGWFSEQLTPSPPR
ncbi:hypothetical protein MK280_11970, partial [Myxococcota bacterium]|nr:hypothetical protein [Myxococcota bacterium]